MSDPAAQRETPLFISSKYGSSARLPGFGGLRERWHATSTGSHLHFFTNAAGVGPTDGPVLILAHGWPQTSYTWRYVIPALQQRIRLFVPDQPGAAHSTAARSGNKAVLGRAYVEALVAVYGAGVSVVLGGHDRGARIMQRLAVSRAELAPPELEVLGAFLIDIVPVAAQFASFGVNPLSATRYFHWAMLPTPLAVPLIMSYGGGNFCRTINERMVGSSDVARASLGADHGIDVYSAWYERQDTNEAAAADYRAGALEDWKEMEEDQKAGRKLDVPVKVIYGDSLGEMHDVQGIWKDYVKDGVPLEVVAAPQGYGHNLQEENAKWTIDQLESFLKEIKAL